MLVCVSSLTKIAELSAICQDKSVKECMNCIPLENIVVYVDFKFQKVSYHAEQDHQYRSGGSAQ